MDVLRSCASASASTNVVLVMVPKAPQSVLSLLEEEGLADRVAVREFCWQMIPVDADVLSLELPHFFSQVCVLVWIRNFRLLCIFVSQSIADGDHSQLAAVSRTLMDLQLLYGPIPSKVAFGQRSTAVFSQLSLLESKLPPSSSASSTSEIAHLLILDRDADFDPCLLSPITYESLLDEVYGITLGKVDLSTDAAKPEKLELSSRDRVFEQIRHRHFGSIFALLSAHARQLKQAQAKAGAMSVDQMKEFVQTGLRDMRANLKSVAVHIGVSEKIQEQKG